MPEIRLVGIDLAWQSENNPSALACGLVDGGGLVLDDLVQDLFTVDSILVQLRGCRSLNGVAVDAPLVIRNQIGQRACEKLIGKEYGARKASCHTSNLTLYPNPDSVRLSDGLEAEGFKHLGSTPEKWQLECYPHPALIEIFGLEERHQYKKGKVAERRAGQVALAQLLLNLRSSLVLPLRIPERLAQPFDPEYIETLNGAALKRNEDILDAVVCVIIAGLYAAGVAERVFGTVEQGYIYVPQRKCI